jgi:chromosomal replication initiator protein
VLPDSVALFIATHIKSSIRDLEGALIRLIAYSSLTGAEITLSMAQQVLKNLVDLQERRVSIENIQRTVCQEFGLTVSQLKASSLLWPPRASWSRCRSGCAIPWRPSAASRRCVLK